MLRKLKSASQSSENLKFLPVTICLKMLYQYSTLKFYGERYSVCYVFGNDTDTDEKDLFPHI